MWPIGGYFWKGQMCPHSLPPLQQVSNTKCNAEYEGDTGPKGKNMNVNEWMGWKRANEAGGYGIKKCAQQVGEFARRVKVEGEGTGAKMRRLFMANNCFWWLHCPLTTHSPGRDGLFPVPNKFIIIWLAHFVGEWWVGKGGNLPTLPSSFPAVLLPVNLGIFQYQIWK